MLVSLLILAVLVWILCRKGEIKKTKSKKKGTRVENPMTTESCRNSTTSGRGGMLPSLLALVNMQTISNMVRWKAEMSAIDTILEGVQAVQSVETASNNIRTADSI